MCRSKDELSQTDARNKNNFFELSDQSEDFEDFEDLPSLIDVNESETNLPCTVIGNEYYY